MVVNARNSPAPATSAKTAPLGSPDRTQGEIAALFVYGSLNDDHHFRLLTGMSLEGIPARLANFRRIHPKNAFAFAVPWSGGHIEGRLLSGVTPALLAKLDEYESAGSLYERLIVEVEAGGRKQQAWIYIADPEAIRPWLERGFAERDRIEAFVEQSVHRYLETKADRCPLGGRRALALAVTGELLSEEIQGLLSQALEDEQLAPWLIKHEIEKADLPGLEWLEGDRKARPFAGAYMSLALRLMIFNQIETRFRHDFRGLTRTGEELYERSLSALMALKLLVDQGPALKELIARQGVDTFRPDFTYPDYAVAALFIAEELWQEERARATAAWVEDHRQPGDTPLGAELEFSQLGVRAIGARENADPLFDGFYYFHDFDLARRGWKLGAHIDDHGFAAARGQRARGFLELAFGRYRLYGDVSKPATRDPWVLAQLIDLAARYIDVKPHSLHLSIQADENIPFKRLENPEYFICLLLLGGDLREDSSGRLREMRIFHGEILHPETGLHLSRLNRHHQRPGEESTLPVVEYQFARLHYEYDYQPLILALKGFQRRANPWPFKGCTGCPEQERHQDLETALKQWAAFPSPISQRCCDDFLEIVRAGLEEEAAAAGERYTRYVHSHLETIAAQLQRRNQRIHDYHQRLRRPEPVQGIT